MKTAVSICALMIVISLAMAALGYQVGSQKYKLLAAEVKSSNRAAAAELERLTAQRDKKQAELNAAYQKQEEADRAAQTEIERLTAELASSAVSVRIEAGACSDGAGGRAAASAGDNSRDPATASGLLPKSNSRRLAAALAEVEQLSAAYASCRQQLYTVRAGLSE